MNVHDYISDIQYVSSMFCIPNPSIRESCSWHRVYTTNTYHLAYNIYIIIENSNIFIESELSMWN